MNFNKPFSFLNNLPKKLNNFYKKNSRVAFKVENKSKTTKDFDPVTNIDRGFEKYIRLQIHKAFPNDAIIVACYTHCKTACTSGGSATIAITAGGVTISPATAFTNNAYDTATQVTDHTGLLNADLGAQATSSAAIGITVATAALTAGLVDIYVDYIPA